MDIVWDLYKKDSLKTDTRVKQGKLKGIRRKVAASTKLPSNWQDFLKDDTNKEELFSFLTSAVSCHTFPEEKSVIITNGIEIRSNQDVSMPQCYHEEADTRMMFHLKHMIENNMQKICIKTVDSDVIVILVGLFFKIAAQVDDVWVEYGAGKYMQYISIRTMYNQLGESRAKALLFFTHSLVQIPHLHSATRAKKQPGILGRHLMKQQKHLRIWQLNHFCLLRMIQKR